MVAVSLFISDNLWALQISGTGADVTHTSNVNLHLECSWYHFCSLAGNVCGFD